MKPLSPRGDESDASDDVNFPALKMKNSSVVDRKRYVQTMNGLKAFLPFQDWPDKMVSLFFGAHTICYRQRLSLACFLAGNGVTHDDINTLLQTRLRDRSAQMHLAAILKAISDGTYDHKWYYFDVRQQDHVYLNGRPYGEARGRYFYTRQLNEWETYVSRYHARNGIYPTLQMQEQFFFLPKN